MAGGVSPVVTTPSLNLLSIPQLILKYSGFYLNPLD
jgi:hypothetical protein